MASINLQNIDPLDIEDILMKVENSFDITFAENELHHMQNFEGLCDHIKSKIHLHSTNDCTKQQAFYKLRHAITTTMDIDRSRIKPSTLLIDLLPRHTRKASINEIEESLGLNKIK